MSSSTEPTASINDLPVEMINELFKYMSPKDLGVCSMVNKRWYSIFAAFKLHRLAVIGRDPYSINENLIEWSYPDRRIEEAEQCRLAMFLRLAEEPLLSNLSHLALSDDQISFDLNKLNRFEKLVHLESYIPFNQPEDVHLNLPRLKVLAFHRFNVLVRLSIDCPLLSTLVYRCEKIDMDLLKVKQPETIRKLDTDVLDPTKLKRFKNVTCLVTQDSRAINKATLLSLPELRELHFSEPIEDPIGRSYAGEPIITVDRLKRRLNKFMDEAKKLRGNDFRLTFCGFDLTNVKLEQIDFGVQLARWGDERVSNEYVYMKNYHLIEPGALHFVRQVDYTRLLSNVTGEFSWCFSQKFTGIYSVHATAKVRSPEHFLWFLKSLRLLRRLSLEKTMLKQEFFDQLPASIHSLAKLNLKSHCCTDRLQPNFDFISRLSRLSELEIEASLPLKSADSLVRTLAKSGKFGELDWSFFSVQLKECVLKIVKHRSLKRSAQWVVKNEGSEWLFETENPEEILNFLNAHQEYTPERSATFG